MVYSSSSPIAIAWFVVLAIASAGGILYFLFGSNAQDKQQLYPWYSIFIALLFLGLVFFGMFAPPIMLLLWVPLLALSTFAHVSTTTFCPRCARMIYRGWLTQTDFCPRCGHALDQSVPGDRGTV